MAGSNRPRRRPWTGGVPPGSDPGKRVVQRKMPTLVIEREQDIIDRHTLNVHPESRVRRFPGEAEPVSALTAEQMDAIRRELPRAVEYANKEPDRSTAFFNRFREEHANAERLREINERITRVFESVPWQPQLTNPSPHHRDARLKTVANLYEDYLKAFAKERIALEELLEFQKAALPEKRKALRCSLLNPLRLLNPFKWPGLARQYKEYRYLKRSYKANREGIPAFRQTIEKAQQELSALFRRIQAEDWKNRATEETARKAEEYRNEFLRIVNAFYKEREAFGYSLLGQRYAKRMARKAERMKIGTTAGLRSIAEKRVPIKRKRRFFRRKSANTPEESTMAEESAE